MTVVELELADVIVGELGPLTVVHSPVPGAGEFPVKLTEVVLQKI